MDIVAWLTDLGLERYAGQFAANEIDEKILRDLSDEDLKDLGVSALGHRKKLLLAIADLDKLGPEAGTSAAAVTLDGTRRQVTVLFADISGFTQLSSELGAEATHDLLNRYFGVVDRIVEGYGGAIDKHIGDNVMAVFGAPKAHNDDPRACCDGRHSRSTILFLGWEVALGSAPRPYRNCKWPSGGERHRQRCPSGIYDHRRFSKPRLASAGCGASRRNLGVGIRAACSR